MLTGTSTSAKDVKDGGSRLTKKEQVSVLLLFLLKVPFCFFLIQVTKTASTTKEQDKIVIHCELPLS